MTTIAFKNNELAADGLLAANEDVISTNRNKIKVYNNVSSNRVFYFAGTGEVGSINNIIDVYLEHRKEPKEVRIEKASRLNIFEDTHVLLVVVDKSSNKICNISVIYHDMNEMVFSEEDIKQLNENGFSIGSGRKYALGAMWNEGNNLDSREAVRCASYYDNATGGMIRSVNVLTGEWK